MDNNSQIRLQKSKEVNHEGIAMRKNGNYPKAVSLFTQAISLFPREEYFYNRALSRLAQQNGIQTASESSDDMLVSMLLGYLEHKDVGQQQLQESLFFYLEKIMQINLLSENNLLRGLDDKVAYRNYILSKTFIEFANLVNAPDSLYREEYLYFNTSTFKAQYNNYLQSFAIGPFNMMLNDQARMNWTKRSQNDVRAFLNNDVLIDAARQIYGLLFN